MKAKNLEKAITVYDDRIKKLISAAQQLSQGNYEVTIPRMPPDQVGLLGETLLDLSQTLEVRYRELQKLNQITLRINSGLLLDEILNEVYRDFREFIPYHRIGFSLIEKEGEVVRAYWAMTDQPIVRLTKGYEALIKDSSLKEILQSGKPRILNDLVAYLKDKPTSESTRLMVEEGMRSSLTCPLIVNAIPVGFIFFSSIYPGTYKDVHVDTFQRIAAQLSVILEKGRLVSQLAEQKKQIEIQNIELKHLDELKSKFLGIAAHDLRNPIANIQMTANMLLSDDLPISVEEALDLIKDIRDQSEYMLTLLEDILDVTQIESGKLELHPEYVELSEFMQDAVNRHQKLAEPKKTQIKLDRIEDGKVYADPLRLRQVLDNLLSNAVKYSPPDSTVYVCVQRQAKDWRFEVQDSGPGISAKDRERLFQDFARLSAQPTGGEKSTGLGLAISKRVVEAHGGTIGVESKPGKGATFWFCLPRDKNPK